MSRRFCTLLAAALLATVTFATEAPPVEAAGVSFDTVQFNICSRKCTEDLPVPGGYDTNYGMNPVAGFLDVANNLRGWPRIISLNEVCSSAAWVFVANLPPNAYTVEWRITAHRPPGCTDYGNIIAVRTLDKAASDASRFTIGYSGPTPPPGDTTSENRGAACAKSIVYLEWILACSTHLAGSSAPTESGTLRGILNASSANQGVMGLGDFNYQPQTSEMAAWRNAGYIDAVGGFAWTYGGNHTHLDYSWFKTDRLAGPDPGAVGYSSASDHVMLWSPIHFR